MVHLKRLLIGTGMLFIAFCVLVITASLPDMVSLYPILGFGAVMIVVIVIAYAIGHGMTT
jgi:hypothetical protein